MLTLKSLIELKLLHLDNKSYTILDSNDVLNKMILKSHCLRIFQHKENNNEFRVADNCVIMDN